jgi:elongation factor Ts
MTEISAALVKQLRDLTGAGILECKKALTENKGDVEVAQNWLMERGLSKAAKKSDRVTAEGLVGVHVEGSTKGAVIEVNSETDFVGRNELFQSFVRNVATLAAQNYASIEDIKSAVYPGSSHSVQEELTRLIATIGENMSLRRFETLSIDKGYVTSYVHNSSAPGVGKIGVLVALNSEASADRLAGFAKQLAMHIAAANPKVTTREAMNKQDILAELGLLPNDPQVTEILERYSTESVLMEQTFIIDGERQIKRVFEDLSSELGTPVTLKGFIRYNLGEGIQKETKDFAAEVAAQLS